MNSDFLNDPLPEESEIGRRNVERLIARAYNPEPAGADFVRRVQASLKATARELAETMPASGYPISSAARLRSAKRLGLRKQTPEEIRILRRTLAWVLSAAALLAGVLLWYHAVRQDDDQRPGPGAVAFDKLTPMRLAAAPAPEVLGVGQTAKTEVGQKRRLALPDGSTLYLNENTTARLDADRQLSLTAGEVFLEVAPRSTMPFIVRTPQREVTARGTKFSVQSAEAGTGVVVTQGKVQVSGLDAVLHSGEQLAPSSNEPAPAPRVSRLLEWTRELMAGVPLVPKNPHEGGSLVAVDPHDQEARLELRKFHIDVHIEDGFARTTIDQTYFNHHPWRLEGTFYFPLPPDASLSRLAMYVDGTLMEGGMVERDHGRTVFETILRSQRDPALLEWLDGSTFKMRVFPLEARQEKRIILSCTQRLDAFDGIAKYRFPAGHNLRTVRDWSFHARLKNGANFSTHSEQPLRVSRDANDLLLDAAAQNVTLDRDVAFSIADLRLPIEEPVRFSTAQHEGARYLMLRYRPDLTIRNPQSAIRNPRHWVFLFESSGDRDPLLARAQIEVIRSVLNNAEDGDTFALLTAGTRVRVFGGTGGMNPPARPENIAAAVAFLEQAHLVGGLDLGNALAAAEPYLRAGRESYLVHVGGGMASLGERRVDALLNHLPENVQYVGVGIGKRVNRPFMKAAAERTGGYLTQVNPDEPIGWRGFELVATLNTPRLCGVQVTATGGDFASRPPRFLSFASTIAQGEEFAAVARIDGMDGLPKTLTLTGTRDGKPVREVIEVTKVTEGAGYLPRSWARLEIDRLLAEDADKNRERIIDLSKAMYVMSPYTSLLVLENEEMYKQFKVDRGRKDHWARYQCPEKVPVVPELPRAEERPTAEQVRRTIRVRPERPVYAFNSGFVDDDVEALLAFGRLPEDLRAPPIRHMVTLFSRDFDRPPSPQFDDLRRSVALGPESQIISGLARELSADHFEARRFREELARIKRSAAGKGAGVSLRVDPDRAASGFVTPGSLVNVIHVTRLANAEPVTRAVLERVRVLRVHDDGATNVTLDIPRVYAEWLTQLGETGRLSLVFLPRGTPEARLAELPTNPLSHAPGMNSTEADASAVVEAEAGPDPASLPGRIDPAARKLIELARSVGWQRVTVPATDVQPGWSLVFDGSGRLICKRTLPSSLKERVLCDGKTLWHLYPELGVGARRHLSRFHRAELAEELPWLVPPVEDLARGADVRSIDERTVAVVPRGAGFEVHYRFAEDGKLLERRTIDPATRKLRERWVIDAGTVTCFDGNSRQIQVMKGTLVAAAPPKLNVDAKDLVVLPLPYRTVEHVRQTFGIKPEQPLKDLPEDAALALFASHFAAEDGKAEGLFTERFAASGKHLLGFQTLLGKATGPFAERLGACVALTRANWQQAYRFIQENRQNALAWSLLMEIHEQRRETRSTTVRFTDLAEAFRLFEDHPEVGDIARYERARCLLLGGERREARRQFKELHARAIGEGWLPAIDSSFREALGKYGADPDEWPAVMEDAARKLKEQNRRLAIVGLAWQALKLGDKPLADRLLPIALAGPENNPDRLQVTLAIIALHLENDQPARAEPLVQGLLDDEQFAKDSRLWRLAASVAERNSHADLAVARLERALALEFARLPEVIDLSAVRQDYGRLLQHYQHSARAGSKELVAKVVRAADRWRALDPGNPLPCQLAAKALTALGAADLAWDYETTPTAR